MTSRPRHREAVNWGGDTDTVCAILGAMCGAHQGPARFRPGGRIACSRLDLVTSRAQALAGDRAAYDAMPDLGEIELRWTIEEDRIRREKTGQPPVDTSGWVRRVVVRQIPPRESRPEDRTTSAA